MSRRRGNCPRESDRRSTPDRARRAGRTAAGLVGRQLPALRTVSVAPAAVGESAHLHRLCARAAERASRQTAPRILISAGSAPPRAYFDALFRRLGDLVAEMAGLMI